MTLHFARCFATPAQAREAHQLISLLQHSNDYVYGERTYDPTIYAAPLPLTLSSLAMYVTDWANFSMDVSWSQPYTDEKFREGIDEGSAEAVFSFHKHQVGVRVERKEGKYLVNGGVSHEMTLQALIHMKRRLTAIPEIAAQIRLDWHCDYPSRPCYVELASGLLATSLFRTESADEAFLIAKKMMELFDRPPTTIGGSAYFRGTEDDYQQFRQKIDENHKCVTYHISTAWGKEVQPFTRPRKLTGKGYHYCFPLAELRGDVALYIFHELGGSYLELVSFKSIDLLEAWTRSFPGLHWDIWPGHPCERWTGDRTPWSMPKPERVLDPHRMFQTKIDEAIHGFVDQRILYLIPTEGQPGYPKICQYTPQGGEDQRKAMGYNTNERTLLSRIDMYCVKFTEIEAYLGRDWDGIRFMLPVRERDVTRTDGKLVGFLERIPNLIREGGVDFEWRGSKVFVPFEIVHDLKRPMN